MEEEKHHRYVHVDNVQEDTIKIPLRLLVSIVVIAIVLVLGFFTVKSGVVSGMFTGGDISEKEATSKLLSWFATNAQESNVAFVSSSKQGSLYEIILSIDGQETPLYVTRDGKNIVVDMIPLE